VNLEVLLFLKRFLKYNLKIIKKKIIA